VSVPAAARLWEVDVARTVAIGLMVAYHAGYDVDMLAPGVDIQALHGGWRLLQTACGSLFLIVVGVSLAISNGRRRARGLRGWPLYRGHLRRAGQVAAAALLVSVATRIAAGDDYVRFGILHCIAVAMLVGPLLVGLREWNLVLAAAVLALGVVLQDAARSGVPGLLVLGVTPTHGALDWYPVLPWLAPAIAGVWLGTVLYPGGRRGRWGERLPTPPAARALGAPGRHALPIYLVHQFLLVPLVAAGLLLAGAEVTLSHFGG
jgi:uncharacterized membrane protein